MSPYLLLGGSCVLIGFALGGGLLHELDGKVLANEKASHQADLNKINAASAKALSDALSKQQVAEGKVSDIETQYNAEVAKHAQDSLNYRAQLASGAQRLRVHVTSCTSTPAGESTPAAGSTDDAAPSADLSPAVATGVITVADSADDTAMRLTALQAYVKTLQDEGYIGKSEK